VKSGDRRALRDGPQRNASSRSSARRFSSFTIGALTRSPFDVPVTKMRLQAAGHPLAGDVAALTNVYLEARFGGTPLSRTKERAWIEAVRRIKALERADS
jgi:hypothetical protein